ncbi:hypothetical protein IW140_005672 [Coemansia sp. RSA 1813]|nr:hypothetical protein LPJ74_005185 [Coemansia sp. RSA 1843]KAJ2087065.1 hypothetical protein IW138_005222 [Coemansia sp. RSA 986]KAJ2212787.1 hypothetical protein EV179_004354 [Coemansia sp. RSA 487]KAJ2564647.1 hypothetical protein IW140_005672 [Coemansia sp. RSA 1813]
MSLLFLVLMLFAATFTAALEVDLLWDTAPSAITTAFSLVRFANDTAPPSTEWIGVGWAYGTLGLSYRADSSAAVVMQLTPPTAAHHAEIGRTGLNAASSHRDTTVGSDQVLLEEPVELDSTTPYYFKVEAHHDLRQNRTTYEGLYSTGSQWDYVGALVLQHPRDTAAAAALSSAISSAIHHNTKAKSSAHSDSDEESDDEDSDNESSETLPSQLRRISATPTHHHDVPAFPDPLLFPQVYSGIRRTNSSDREAVRAGVFKRMALRDRLGQSFMVQNPRAVMYDADDDAMAPVVRHYLTSSSFLIALGAPRAQT